MTLKGEVQASVGGGRGEPRLPPRVCNAMEVLLLPLLPAQDV